MPDREPACNLDEVIDTVLRYNSGLLEHSVEARLCVATSRL
jgi:hypothetical protein